MSYTIDDLEQDMEEIQRCEQVIREDRGARYGTKQDTLGNISTFGADGAIVHANECFCRIKNMFGEAKDIEDLENAVMDGRNYLAYILILARREQ